LSVKPTDPTFESFEKELDRLVESFGKRLSELKQPAYAEARLRDDFLKLRAGLCRRPPADSEKAVLQKAVTAADQQIDQLVYEIYQLTPQEIALVEGAA